MAVTSYWADGYIEKKRDDIAAMALIKSGYRVFIGSSCGEPQCLVRALSEVARRLSGVEVIRLLSLENAPLTLIADKTHDQNLTIRSFYLGSAKSKTLAQNMRFLTPINLSAVPQLFKSRMIPIQVALIQVCPPDDFGWMSLGVSVDITLAAALSADVVIAQVNPKMPRVLGRCFIHVNDVDVIVEHEEALLTIGDLPASEEMDTIGKHIANIIDDDSTIQIGLGTSARATMAALSEKNDLGIHSQFLTNEMMHLVSRGVITNRKKGFNDGKLVASNAIGTRELYDFLHYNPSVDFNPSDYVNDPRIISRHNKMVSINVVMTIDLTGQVAADSLPLNHFSGVTGLMDFIKGAAMSAGGKSILMLTSTAKKGKKSRIVPMLSDTAVVVPRGEVQYVVTEYGAVNLFGKSYQERAMGMISIAHPDFRDELFQEAKTMGLLGMGRKLGESIHGIYPVKLEEVILIDGEKILLRPTKPVDERRIQEHFYSLDRKDIISRFFHDKKRFVRGDLKGLSQIDYIHNLTIIAVVGEIGFGRVVGVGEYYLQQAKNMAEVAFSVSREFQGKGLGTAIIRKLAEAAMENGISGLFAYTALSNKKMINLFNSLPYKVNTVFSDDLWLGCKFDTAN